MIPPPGHLSDAAQAYLEAEPQPALRWPDPGDAAAWRRLIAARDAHHAALRAPILAKLAATTLPVEIGSCPVYRGTPAPERLLDHKQVLLDFHGGALVFGGGETLVRFEAAAMALRTGRVTYAVDYSRPPDSPYPAALDEGEAVYRKLLNWHDARDIALIGTSAGGNLVAALLMRLRDAGAPLPAGAVLLTPELDLTEGGDSFKVLAGHDPVLPTGLDLPSRAYAAGAPLNSPELSPLFGEVSGLPPMMLQAGSRDLLLSNAIRMHRKLRRADIRAELHLWDAMPHGGFGGSSAEDLEVNDEIRCFLGSL